MIISGFVNYPPAVRRESINSLKLIDNMDFIKEETNRLGLKIRVEKQ